MLWTLYFLEAQGYKIEDNILYQDKKSSIIYRPLSGIGISYGIFHPLLCDFKPELWQVQRTILAYFCLILGLDSLNKCYTSETRSHNYVRQ
jgi:hypothetical protein